MLRVVGCFFVLWIIMFAIMAAIGVFGKIFF